MFPAVPCYFSLARFQFARPHPKFLVQRFNPCLYINDCLLKSNTSHPAHPRKSQSAFCSYPTLHCNINHKYYSLFPWFSCPQKYRPISQNTAPTVLMELARGALTAGIGLKGLSNKPYALSIIYLRAFWLSCFFAWLLFTRKFNPK